MYKDYWGEVGQEALSGGEYHEGSAMGRWVGYICLTSTKIVTTAL